VRRSTIEGTLALAELCRKAAEIKIQSCRHYRPATLSERAVRVRLKRLKPPLPTGTVQRVIDLALGRRREKQPTGPAGCWRKPQGCVCVRCNVFSKPTSSRRTHVQAVERPAIRRETQRRRRVLYVDPRRMAHAAVLSVDQKSQIQAFDRTEPGLPMKPAAPAR
jgi:hypothetical protein